MPTTLAVPLRFDEHGVFYIGDSRVTLDSVIYAFRRGSTPEAIAEKYPTLALPDVYLVTAYYLKYQSQVDAYLQEQEARAAATRERVEQDFPAEGVRARLVAKLDAKRRS
jgi:uncharacterized protein (DUF433 family)